MILTLCCSCYNPRFGIVSAMGIERVGLGSQEALIDDARRRAHSNVESVNSVSGMTTASHRGKIESGLGRYSFSSTWGS